MKPEKDPHHSNDGHRKRVKAKIQSEGCKALTDVDLLEAILFYAIPRRDVKGLAEKLINEFGTFSAVVQASHTEIAEIIGVKPETALLFSLLRESVSRTSAIEGDKNLLDGGRLKAFLIDLFKGKEAETVYALYFSEEGEYIGRQTIFRGGISSARFSLRKITEGVIRVGGKAVILAHNHPSDRLIPSGDDIISTKRIASHLAANEINLIDHYIVGSDDAVGIFSEINR